MTFTHLDAIGDLLVIISLNNDHIAINPRKRPNFNDFPEIWGMVAPKLHVMSKRALCKDRNNSGLVDPSVEGNERVQVTYHLGHAIGFCSLMAVRRTKNENEPAFSAQ